MPVLEAFRNRQLPWAELVQRNMQSALDFERLYTNLPQNDLTLRLHRNVDEVFAMHQGAVAVLVWKQKVLPHLKFLFVLFVIPLTWLPQVPPQAELCGRENGQQFQAFTPASLKWLLSFLVEHTYVQFTGRVYQQKMGIPMGISPAVFISNYYLHTYEYDFYAQLRPMQAAAARSLASV